MSNSLGVDRWVRSPVWMRKSGFSGSGVDPNDGLFERGDHTLLVGVLAKPDVAVADLGEREPAPRWPPIWPNARDEGIPPPIVQRSPVPAQAMHLRKPRRSTPSLARSGLLEVVIRFLPESQPQVRGRSGPVIRGLQRASRRDSHPVAPGPQERIHRVVRPGLVLPPDGGDFLGPKRRGT